jgi:haloacetate dehalogenase
MFDNFALDHIDLGEATLRVRHGGSGPPVVLLHGHPRTHATWNRVAPLLADRHTVVCPDLRGYGQSSKPADMSKRAMARDVVALMERLGHERFAVAGHDRGAIAAYRTALDHPDRVVRLAVLDGIPVIEHLERCHWRFAAGWWHWWFFAQTAKPAERYISADPDAWYTATPEHMGEEAYADLRAALRDPETVHAMVEDYRAGLRADREHDEADRAAGRRVRCPTLLLEARDDDLDIHGDPVPIWQPWLDQPLRHRVVDSGHHQAEQAPEQVAEAVLDLLAGR